MKLEQLVVATTQHPPSAAQLQLLHLLIRSTSRRDDGGQQSVKMLERLDGVGGSLLIGMEWRRESETGRLACGVSPNGTRDANRPGLTATATMGIQSWTPNPHLHSLTFYSRIEICI